MMGIMLCLHGEDQVLGWREKGNIMNEAGRMLEHSCDGYGGTRGC